MKNAARLLFSAALILGLAGCVKDVNEADYSDTGIKERLESQLKTKKNLDLRYITIDVHSGVVTMSGISPSYEERDSINSIAKKITGVDQVILNIVVQE